MKSVLFISRTYSDRPGGMQTYAKTLARALGSRSDLLEETCGFAGPLYALPYFFFHAMFRAVFSGADTVLLGDAVLSPLILPLMLLRPRTRRVVIVHGLDLTWRFPLYQAIIGFCLRRAHRLVAVSRSTAVIAERLGIHPDRIIVIPCPVQPSPFKRLPRRHGQLLLLGRLIRRKGTLWFLKKVLPLLLAERPDLTVIVAGDGPERGAIDEFLRSFPFKASVILRGVVTDEQKDRLLRESALLVVPNVRMEGDAEGFGIVCLEAGIRHLPVVAARVDGLPDAVVENVTGLFFEFGAAEDCVRAIFEALRSNWNEESMRKAIAERFDASVIASRFVHDVF